ncbi:FliC/FljB family flagellin [Microbulbifer thermotolerans]|uniref:FliC/FljB family flagellin n=1 Tax=Microbulbifer thermotolerans TaxID=252514 RepID=UPI002248D350|nr:FliC/FljB family flagellin [Microbulbifer thermotolerans]MCX2831918.1 FliC/FljB family flagellin [Microbulbifer thermotolerans]
MSVINTNITALIGQQNLSKSQSALQTSMERLSSGLRINSAKDDAAGQAIANRMSAQITGLSQAQRNANDGISVAQTAEGALNQVNENLQRIRELTVQSQNGTNSADDLKSIQAEIDQRLTEINRISEQTDFNGVKVLSEDQNITIQVGANDGESIDVALKKIDAESLGLTSFSILGISNFTTATDFAAAQEFMGATTSVSTMTVAAMTGGDFGFASATAASSSATVFADDDGNYYAKVTIDGTLLSDIEVESLAAAGIEVDTSSTNEVYMSLEASEGSVSSNNTLTFDATGTAELSRLTTVGSSGADALATLDDALKQVDTLRSDLGAIQNRFESAITNLQTNATNLSAARSRIEDADYAEEVSNMTRAQILQQAGTSVLAQANQIPQNVLSLLG